VVSASARPITKHGDGHHDALHLPVPRTRRRAGAGRGTGAADGGAPPGFDPIRACSHPGQERLRAVVEAVANAEIDEDAPVIRQARFTPRGQLIIVDDGLGEVVLMGSDLEPIRTIGRRGREPGEYSQPADAVQGNDGTIFVLDRSPARLILFDSLGNRLRAVPLPLVAGGSVAVDDTAAYVSTPILWVALEGPRPSVVRYDLASGELTTLLETGPSWKSRPPMYNNREARTLLRAGRDGRLYLTFPEAYQIWRVEGPGRYTEVVHGCVPDALLEEYREPSRERQWRRTLTFIADFAVLADGRVLVRSGTVDRTNHRPLELFGTDGELERPWLLAPAREHGWHAAIDPLDPTRMVSWPLTTGTTRLHRVEVTCTFTNTSTCTYS